MTLNLLFMDSIIKSLEGVDIGAEPSDIDLMPPPTTVPPKRLQLNIINSPKPDTRYKSCGWSLYLPIHAHSHEWCDVFADSFFKVKKNLYLCPDCGVHETDFSQFKARHVGHIGYVR